MTSSVLLIGLGAVGMHYDLHSDDQSMNLTHARAFANHPVFHLAGGVDPDLERRRVFSERYHAPAFADAHDALDALTPELVVIATPTKTHAEHVRMVLDRARPRAILCEKPLSYDFAEAQEMVQSCADQRCGL